MKTSSGQHLLVLKLAWRSLWRNKRRTLITLSSIALGLTFSIFFASFVTGMHKKTVGDVTRMLAGHVTVEHKRFRDDPSASLFVPSVAEVRSAAQKYPEIQTIKPIVVGQAMASTASGSVGIGFMGVDPDVERPHSLLAHKIIRGRYLESGDSKGVLVGSKLAERLKLDIDSKLVLTTADSKGEIGDTLLRVVGVFETGSEEVDVGLLQMPLSVARRVFALEEDQATQVGIILSNPDAQARVIAGLQSDLRDRDVAVQPWQALLPQIASWMKMTSTVHRVLGVIILLLVTATILNTILMSVLERGREFAVLLALGTPPKLLRAQVMVESVLVGTLGALAGAAIGASVALLGSRGIDIGWASKQGMSVGGFALDMRIRTHLDPVNLAFLAALVLVFTCASGIYPVMRSTRMDLANALRSR